MSSKRDRLLTVSQIIAGDVRRAVRSATATRSGPRARTKGKVRSMKAVTFAEYGGPEVLQVTDVSEPEPGPGQIRIAVRAAGVNPIDWKIRSGGMKDFMPLELPAIDAREAAGVVDAVGPDVEGVAVGDEVFGFASGGAAAEKALLSAWAAKPRNVSFEEAAGLPVAVETSIRVFTLLGGVGDGDTIVIDGAAGGV